MASFGGVTFIVDTDSFQESRDGRVNIVEIPGGDTFYVDRAGRSPLKLSLSILLPDASAWGTLTSLIGQEQTLSVETLDTHLAVLMSASRSAQNLDGTSKASVSFVVTNA